MNGLDALYVITGSLSLATCIVAGLLGRQAISRLDQRRNARRGR